MRRINNFERNVNVLFKVKAMSNFFFPAVTPTKQLAHITSEICKNVALAMFVLLTHCREVIYEAVNRQRHQTHCCMLILSWLNPNMQCVCITPSHKQNILSNKPSI